jgi:hypothetical protein
MSMEDKDRYITTINKRIDECYELLEIQASVLTDEYMKGMYNGMELILAVIEDREPVYASKILRNSKQNLNNSQRK